MPKSLGPISFAITTMKIARNAARPMTETPLQRIPDDRSVSANATSR